MNPLVYTYSLQVQESAIDDLSHVNNVVYLQWCLDAAELHWMELSSPEQRKEYAWVVLRHEINYLGSAVLGDEVVIETWVNWSLGVKSERAYRITLKGSGKTIVTAKTLWCLIDRNSGRPSKIPEDMINLFGQS